MKPLFNTNLFLADCDSVYLENQMYQDHFPKKIKSALLLSESIGISPNMIFDSLGFESILDNDVFRKFFIKKF